MLKQGRWVSALAAAVMPLTGVILLVDGKEYGWLMIVGADLMVISMVLLAIGPAVGVWGGMWWHDERKTRKKARRDSGPES